MIVIAILIRICSNYNYLHFVREVFASLCIIIIVGCREGFGPPKLGTPRSKYFEVFRPGGPNTTGNT